VGDFVRADDESVDGVPIAYFVVRSTPRGTYTEVSNSEHIRSMSFKEANPQLNYEGALKKYVWKDTRDHEVDDEEAGSSFSIPEILPDSYPWNRRSYGKYHFDNLGRKLIC